jgi:hypothetical protein
MKATWVTIHHEGAGAPTDRVSRFLNTDKYSAGIGITRYELWRSPEASFITTGQKGHCIQICLSGNRMVHAVTDTDIQLIGNCCNEARVKGWLIDHPDVKHHGDNHKSACPGSNTNNRRSEIRAACQAAVPMGSPLPLEGDDDVPTGAQMMAVTPPGGGYWVVGSDGGVFAYGDAGFFGSMGGKKMNAPVVGITATPSGQGYYLLGQDGGIFCFGDANMLGAPTGEIR